MTPHLVPRKAFLVGSLKVLWQQEVTKATLAWCNAVDYIWGQKGMVYSLRFLRFPRRCTQSLMGNQHRYPACPSQEFANSAQRIHKTDEVIKVRSGRQRVQKTTERVVHLMRIDTVSSSKRKRPCFCKGEEFLARKVNVDIMWIYDRFGFIKLVMIVILSSSYLPWSTHGLLFEKRDGCAPHHIVVKDSLIS